MLSAYNLIVVHLCMYSDLPMDPRGSKSVCEDSFEQKCKRENYGCHQIQKRIQRTLLLII